MVICLKYILEECSSLYGNAKISNGNLRILTKIPKQKAKLNLYINQTYMTISEVYQINTLILLQK